MTPQLNRRDLLKVVGLVSVAGAGAGALTACAPAEPDNPGGGGGGGATGEFHGAWPYKPAPEGHYNFAGQPYAGIPTVIMGDSPYRDLMVPPSAFWLWEEKKWEYLIAESHKLDEAAGTLTIKVRNGLKWNDGNPVTSKDYLASLYVQFIQRSTLWNFITGVEAPDDSTVVLKFTNPPAVLERYVLKSNIVAAATYQQWADKAKAILDAKKTMKDPEGVTLGQDFQKFRPDKVIVSGPYDFDYATITNTQLTLVRNDKGYGADKVKFAKLVIYAGETTEVTPLVQSKDVDYATHGFAPASEKAFQSVGYRILRPPVYSGPALYMNQVKLPEFADVRARQALAHVIDRAQNGQISLADSGKAVKYMVGFSDNQVQDWLSADAIGKLNTYDKDLTKAADLLTQAGWRKQGDSWMTPAGKPAAYEIQFPGTFADWSASGKDVADQLTKFGIKVTARGLDDKQAPIDIDKGNFELAIQSWGSGAHPHPHFSFVADLFTHNIPIAKNVGGQGYGFALDNVKTSTGTVNLEELVTKSGQGLNLDEQKKNVSTVAVAFNELLPIIPIFERYGNNPALDGTRVTGFPADGDPLLKNAPYADNFVIIGMYRGTVKPVG